MIKLREIIEEFMIEALSPATQPPAIHIQHQEFSPDFIKYIKTVENSIYAGFDKQKKLWFPYKDIAGWNIAYGHKLEDDEIINFKNGIDQKTAEKILIQDLQIAKQRMRNYIKKTYNVNIMLSKKQEEMLMDFSFSLGGLEKFPKFTDAVLRNNWNTAKKEYIRSSAGKKLTGRNEAFFNRFLL
jgi:GH24 family phage-related lysozyme (muramidase)